MASVFVDPGGIGAARNFFEDFQILLILCLSHSPQALAWGILVRHTAGNHLNGFIWRPAFAPSQKAGENEKVRRFELMLPSEE
jgi:hypothetical protein